MRRRYAWTLTSLALGLTMLLVACRPGGTPATPTPESTTPPVATTAPTASPTASPVATPEASPIASPTATRGTPAASPSASPAALAQPVTLAEALDNLEQQGSYVMHLDVAGFAGAETLLPGSGDTFEVTLQRSGQDRHVRVLDGRGNRVIELWRVDGQELADFGPGPLAVTSDTPIIGRLLPLLDLDSRFLRALSGDDADYTITGTDTVNGTEATVEEATYEVSGASRAMLVASDTATVDSTMWVATEDQYLLRLDLVFTPTGATPTTETQQATAHVEVTDIGTAPPVTAPAP